MSETVVDRALAQRWFRWAVLFELLLVVVGLLLTELLRRPPEARFHWNAAGLAWGVAAVVPLLIVLAGIVTSPWKVLQQIPLFLDTMARPVLEKWSLLQFALISLLAGAGEELLFRGVLQSCVSQWLGPALGVLSASALFGVCHWVTPAYGVVAALIGGYMGLLLVWSANLLVPAVTHAVYDFLALIYFVRLRRAPGL